MIELIIFVETYIVLCLLLAIYENYSFRRRFSYEVYLEVTIESLVLIKHNIILHRTLRTHMLQSDKILENTYLCIIMQLFNCFNFNLMT